MPEYNVPNTEDKASAWGRLASVIACVLTVLMITPLAPAMPFPGLDGSWSYAMNIATAEHLRFGKDIVFTFGPLASIYTRVYSPATDWMMLLGSALIAVALFAGFFAVASARKRVFLLILPVVISLAWGRDAVFMLVPVLIPFVLHRGVQRGRAYTAALCLLASASAILPLVKGNFGLLLGLAVLVSVIMCWRVQRRSVLLIIAVAGISLLTAWLASGQRLLDLPGYFIAQAPIVSGYTDAMSVSGSLRDIVFYLLAAPVLMFLSVQRPVREYWYAPVMVAAYLFVAFKSGFVRHDEHAFVAAVALAYVGFLIVLTRRGRWGATAFVVAMLAWAGITHTYARVGWDSSVARFAEMVRKPLLGTWQRLTQPDVLSTQYAAITAGFGQRAPFAGYVGEADVYPVDLAALIGSGATWKPRPVLQSYSVYTPALLRANAKHLQQAPPARVYFNADPIDHRYPALEDGASWLSLLAAFTPKALEGGYAVLERRDEANEVLQPVRLSEVNAVLGKDVAVAAWQEPVWVTLDIQPTLLGKLFSTFYKAPKLSMKVRYEDGSTADYRMIAGMAQTGFLLSPTVSDAKDFIALRSSYMHQLLDAKRVVSFGVAGDRGTSLLWKLDYRVAFSRLDVPLSVEADRILVPDWQAAQPLSSYPVSGDCNIDEADQQPVSASMDLPKRLFTIRGWAALDGRQGKTNDGTFLLITSGDTVSYRVATSQVPRPDVSAHFQQPGLEHAGYEVTIDGSRLPEEAQIHVLQSGPQGDVQCAGATITLRRLQAKIPSS